MGRRIHANVHISSLDPSISFSLLVACGAATMAIISALCVGRFKKKTSLSSRRVPEKSRTEANSQMSERRTSITIEENGTNTQEDKNDDQLPLPPGKRNALERTYSCKNYMTKCASARDAIAVSSSMSSSQSRSVTRTMSAVRDLDKKKSKVKSQDSVWMKSIILGEKCKVPDDEDGNNILYDVGKGKKIQTYYPRTQNL